jgi:hypothetical protein
LTRASRYKPVRTSCASVSASHASALFRCRPVAA